MKMKTAWSRGLLYGSVLGGMMGIFPIAAAIFGDVPLNELALVGAMVVGIWGGLGFLVGYASHFETSNDSAGNPVTANDVSLFKRLVYRFVAGLLLSYGAAAVVSGIGFVAFYLWLGDFDGPARTISEIERRMWFIAFCGMLGAETGTVAGCWLGALLMPGGNQFGPVARRAFHSAILGMLGGGWIGGMVGGLQLHFESERDMIAILAALAGAAAGMAAAIYIRRRGFF
jgi:hypothetical protein